MTTLRTIKELYSDAENCTQEGGKQLFIVDYKDYSLLLSYVTIVGIRASWENWKLTKDRYSVTTSKQCNQFERVNSCERVEETELVELVAKHHRV